MTWTAVAVLDTYSDLIRRLRHPSGNMASFMAFKMNQDLCTGGKRLQYYPVMPGSPSAAITEAQGGEFAAFLGTGLVGAPAYQVTEEMCEIIAAMFARTVAEDAPVIYEANLPAAAGLVWLDTKLQLTGEDGSFNQIQALSWAAHSVLAATGTIPVLRVALWTLASDTTKDDTGHTPADAAEIADIQARLGVLTMLYSDIYPLGQPMGEDGHIPPRSAVALVAYLNMLWMMLQMEITGIDRAPGIRAAQRRARRYLGDSGVLVVTLRRAAHGDHGGDDHGEPPHHRVDWSCRWIVQTHYRHHVAPPRRAWHQAIPTADRKRCTVCGAEVSYIPPYIKGPEGAPIRVRARLNRLAR
jgi:hypothetical protein